MATKLALVLQNVKHAFAPHRIVGPWIALGAADHGRPRRARAPRRAAPALGAARWAADLQGVANGLRHQPRLAQHPVEGATGATHRGSWGCGLFPYAARPFADGSARAAARLGGRRARFSRRPDPIAARPAVSRVAGVRLRLNSSRLKPVRLDPACRR